MKSLLHVELLWQDARKNKDRRRTSRWDTDLNIDFRRMFAPWLRLRGFSLFSETDLSVAFRLDRTFICEDDIF